MMEHNYVIWIPKILFFYVKAQDFYEDIANDVEKYLIHQTIKSIDHYLQERIKKQLD